MQIAIKVIPKAKKAKVEERDGALRVYVRAAPEKGRANKEVVATLAEYYGVAKRNIVIIKGETSGNKIIRVER